MEESLILSSYKNLRFLQMEKPLKGDVVVVPFPFSDLSASKRRPALVCAGFVGGDSILCQITSQARFDDHSIVLADADFETGTLDLTSMIRPDRLFTADRSIIIRKVGKLKKEKMAEVTKAIVKIFSD